MSVGEYRQGSKSGCVLVGRYEWPLKQTYLSRMLMIRFGGLFALRPAVALR